jgi:hypothetical protein
MTDTNKHDQDTNAEAPSLRTYQVNVMVQSSRTYEVQAHSPREAVDNYNEGDVCAESDGEELQPDSVLVQGQCKCTWAIVPEAEWKREGMEPSFGLARDPVADAEAAEVLPVIAVTVRGGLIEDMDATIPVHVIVEDWDVPDEDTGKKPTRSVHTLAGGL